MIRFCVGLRDQLKKGKYEFLRKTFGLPSAATVSKYDSYGGNEPDFVLYSTLKAVREEFKLDEIKDEWKQMFTLSWDACYTSDKVQYNYHTCDTCGFADDAFNLDILASEFENMGSVDNHDAIDVSKKRAKQYLLFMVQCWEKILSQLKGLWIDMLSEMAFL